MFHKVIDHDLAKMTSVANIFTTYVLGAFNYHGLLEDKPGRRLIEDGSTSGGISPTILCGEHVHHSLHVHIKLSSTENFGNIRGTASLEDSKIDVFLDHPASVLCNKDWSVIWIGIPIKLDF